MEWRDLSTRSRDANNHLLPNCYTHPPGHCSSLCHQRKKKTKRPTTCLKLDTLLLWKFVFGARKKGTPTKEEIVPRFTFTFYFYCFSILFFLFDFSLYFLQYILLIYFFALCSLLFTFFLSFVFYLVNPCQPFLQCYSSKMF